ncbi:MAG: amidohydrolase family protein [Candidatus Heimdallarchaeota archaeon]|nr:amidohydrolase family protein [Candidatus Heimdallarchaeota archaeon]
MVYDVVIKNGRIVDGTGHPTFLSSLAIKDGKITKIEKEISDEARLVIDAKGLVISPGFIDIHSHSDSNIPISNKLESMITQGITTAAVGQCGSSLAPISDETFDLFKKEVDMWSPPGVEVDLSWRSFEEYLTEMEKGKCSMNIVPVVGFGTIRLAGGPGYEDRPPTTDELAKMQSYVEEALVAGAFGFSTGLIYSPQVYAKTEEVIELAKIVAKYDRIYFSHIRDEGAKVVEAVEEFIRIVEESGCKSGQIAHHKASGITNWGISKKTLQIIREANQKGLDITCDQYPYNRSMTSLITILPPWVHIGGIESILERLSDEKIRERIKNEMETGLIDHENFAKHQGFENIFISSIKTDKWADIEGKSIAEITKIRNLKDDYETVFTLILDEKGEIWITIKSMGEEDIKRIMTSKYSMIGTDGSGVSPTGPLSHGKPHPRFYGTFPRVLGKFVREEQWFSLEEAIWKMTGFPAKKLGLEDRGLVKENYFADLVIFNPETVIDEATFDDPHRFSKGIEYVIVNGKITVEKGIQNEVLEGKILRK